MSVKSGDACTKCERGRLRIATSKPSACGGYYVQTLQCATCGEYHTNKAVVLAESVRRRKFA